MPYQSISTRNKSRGIKGKFKKKDEPLNSSNNDTDQLSNSLSSRIFSTAKSSQHQHQQHNYCKDPISSFVQEECVLIAEDKDCDWQSGRRVVELGMLAEGLRSCECCPNPLYLHNTVNIRSVGLASVLDVQCSSCGRINNVHSGKKHGKIYDMNTKLALALLHSGVGLAQINSILSSLNIPAVHHTMIMRRQNEAGLAVELTAKESSEKYLNEEVKLSEEAEDLAVFQTAVSSTFVFGSPEPKAQSSQKNGIEVSVDAGWQKRGSGRSYDSLSGHCSMIGVKTGKVLSYAVRSKTCRVCSNSKRSAKSGKCNNHNCRKNWKGSAKAMEPDMVAGMIQQTSEKGVLVTGIVGDDDATTAARLKSTISHPIQKRSDKNHVTKNFANHLYSLQKTFPALTSKVRNYLLKLFNYCISQNKHDHVGISRGLDAIVNHPYGDHSYCDDTWCKFKRQPDSKYMSLPYGKPMKDEKLRAALRDVFGAYKKVSGKLCNLGSTQANESLNKSIASKAPKQLHFSGSASLNYRVAASVAQKNVGHIYLSNVNQKLGISPGTYTSKLSLLRDLQHRKRRAIAITRAAKQRRIKLKQERHSNEALQEVKEGPTYATNIDEQNVDVTTIPPPVPKPGPVGLDTAGNEFVYFDLETTGLERTSHIVQIAAIHGSYKFSIHVMPQKKISPKASEITNLTVVGQSMFFNGQKVAALPINSALDSFNAFLCKCKKNDGSPVMLVGHNIETFDCKVLLYAVESCKKFSEFQKNVCGFVDTYKLFKKEFTGLKSYKQEELVRTLLGESYMAHSALEDVIALQKLVISVHLDQTVFNTHEFSLDRAVQSYDIAKNVAANIKSLQPMIDTKVISAGIARSIAGSGLKFHHLCLASKRNGADGLRKLLSEVTNGHIRVTKSERIIMAIADYVCKYH